MKSSGMQLAWCEGVSRFDVKHWLLLSLTTAAATTLAASILSKLQTGRGAAALNATSHIVWGKRAFRANALDREHTLVGAVLNAGAMLIWCSIYELLPEPSSLPARLVKAAGVTAASYATDFYVVPRRFTPGFEERLSPRALAAVYVALGAGLLLAPRSA